MTIDAGTLLLGGLGAFWLLGAGVFGRQMSRGRLGPIQALHQDLAPSASHAAWQFKNAAMGLVGAVWLTAAAARAGGAAWAPALAAVAATAIAVEQAVMPFLSPRHWKSYSGLLVGAGLAAAAVVLGDGVAGGLQIARAAQAHGASLLLGLALLFSALFAGGLGFIAAVLLPAWRALTARAFTEQFMTMLPRAERLMPRLGRATALPLAALFAARAASGSPVSMSLWVAALGLAAVFGISLSINVPINRRFQGTAALADGEVESLRRRWSTGHYSRTGAALVCLIALMSASLG